MAFFKKKSRSKKGKYDPKGYVTVKDFRKGDYIRLTGKNGVSGKKTYIRGEYDRATKKYVLIDCNDVWGNGRLVKGTTPANDDFTY